MCIRDRAADLRREGPGPRTVDSVAEWLDPLIVGIRQIGEASGTRRRWERLDSSSVSMTQSGADVGNEDWGGRETLGGDREAAGDRQSAMPERGERKI
ncbi:hypothetical protein E2562_003160 [Oryza meyeriana var. granulata]|uniref:Uncharacterized protein n=1 Tax=Oryza meyeriana var. granulata TaxID=110450 RepID=A0A6G1EUQ0_9ORYZ|nr:hypothetical protein E2562_003160 [Oryza meyeriana var. granulata]